MEKLRIANERLNSAREKHELEYHAEIGKLNNKENELLQRLSDLDNKKQQTAQEHGEENLSQDDIVEIMAGGKLITARRSTLTQLKGTRLEALFCGRWDKELQRDSNGRIFLDVNSVCFQAIVDYLNELTISSLDDLPDPPNVDEEYNHILRHQLQLFGLMDKMPPDTNILKDSYSESILHGWLKEDNVDGTFRLLYRLSRDGKDSQSFHSKCNDKGPTITIIETTDGHIVGGYSNVPWSSSGSYTAAEKAFLFILPEDGTSSPCKMKLKNPNDGRAVRNLPDWGPIFGEGNHDLYVSIDNSVVHSNFGNTYRYETAGRLESDQVVGADWKAKAYDVREMEVFTVASTHKEDQTTMDHSQSKPVHQFTPEINEAINLKRESLYQAELELIHLEDSFEDEQAFISSFASGAQKDVVVLNVSGTIIAVKRSTLKVAEDSVLAQQFDNTKWTEQRSSVSRVSEWTSEEVCNWINNIPGIQDDVVQVFRENSITGYELLALKKEGLAMMDITRPGTVCVILDEIRKLDKKSYDNATLIEHSPYCFGKILDYLRMKHLHSLGFAEEEPALPSVCDEQRRRFDKVVKYYFPGDSSKFILG